MFFFIVIILGLSGIVAQIILLRELIVIFNGNELSIGVIIANWLLLETIGAFIIGKIISSIKNKITIFVLLNLFFAILLPVLIYITRVFKSFLGIAPIEGIGFLLIVISSFLILLPVSIIHGGLFPYSCELYQKKVRQIIGKVYIFETVGTVIGGIFFAYFLIIYFHSFYIAFLLLTLNIFACALILFDNSQKKTGFIFTILSFISFLILFTEIPSKLHKNSIKKQWEGYNIIHSQDSIYGNILVVKNNNQSTFFYNGIPIITSPEPNILYNEEVIHFSMLTHHKPENILIIGNGAGGKIFEILKYKEVKNIDYVEPDPLLIELLKRFSDDLIEKELKNNKVKTYNTDGRFFIYNSDKKYDVIIIGINEIMDLKSNRFFTLEFYNILKTKLFDNGIITTILPGSYISPTKEIINLNASIINSLKNVFPFIKIIPGDHNIILSSTHNFELTPELLNRRINEKKISTNILTTSYLNYRLSESRLNLFTDRLKEEDKKALINTDFQPLGMFYNILNWNAKFSPWTLHILSQLEKIKIIYILFFIFFIMCILVIFKKIIKNNKNFLKILVPYITITTGFSSMLFDLILIFGFQILYGYIYHHISLLVSMFMAGTIIGVWLINNYMNIKNYFFILKKIEISILLFAILLIIIFYIPKIFTNNKILFFLLPYLFLILCFISGGLTGAEFPISCKLYYDITQNTTTTAGTIYSSDLFGGWLGGIFGSFLLLPLLGVVNTCIIIIAFKATILYILYNLKNFQNYKMIEY